MLPFARRLELVPSVPEGSIPEPLAPELPFQLEDGRVDVFYWLRERQRPEVRRYLEEENRYLEQVLAPWEPLRRSLEEELRFRVPDEDVTPPWRCGSFLYYRRFASGLEYPILCRRPLGAPREVEEVLLDVNVLAEGSAYFHLCRFEPSPSGRYLAYAIDTLGRRLYALRVLDTESGAHLEDQISPTTGDFEWSDDETGLFYLEQDPETLRSERLRYHQLGTATTSDFTLYFEQDPTFSLNLVRSASRKYLILTARQTLTTECRWFLPRFPLGSLEPLLPRQRGLEYYVEHWPTPAGDQVLLLLNDVGGNFRLVLAPSEAVGDRSKWRGLVPCREDVLLLDVRPYRRGIAVLERSSARPRLRILSSEGMEQRVLSFSEEAFALELDPHGDFDGPLRFGYGSLATPWTVLEEDFETGARVVLYREPVGGSFDPSLYRTRRLWIPARDGVLVPVSLVFRSDCGPLDQAPVLLEAYGAYGINLEPVFDPSFLPLLDRGWIVALAHVRGGQELGRAWYEQGRGLSKRHTFEDFVDVAEGLVTRGYGKRDRLFAWGGSAGGLLVAVVANERPELFRGIIAAVPFVDVVTTMSDPSIPLTTAEYDEWGDPSKPEDREYLLSYSPYDNVKAQAYPHMLVTTGFQDSQVQYWEPAKWVAKLRKHRTDRSKWLFLRTEFDAGHWGTSGRYRRLGQRALEWCFLLALSREGERSFLEKLDRGRQEEEDPADSGLSHPTRISPHA